MSPKGRQEKARWQAYAVTLLMIVAATGAGLVLQQFLASPNVALVFLTAVLGSAVAYGLWPSLFGCLLSVAAYNFFFLQPLYTPTVTDPENAVTLFFFVVVAVIVSNLTSRVRSQAIAARERARTTEELYQFSRKLTGAISLDDLLSATAFQIASMLQLRAALLLPEGGRLALRAGYPADGRLSAAELTAAEHCLQSALPTGRGSPIEPASSWMFLPIRTGRGAVGVVGLARDADGPVIAGEQRRLLDALTDQAALAIERVNLAAAVDRARLVAETDRLRTALFTSISHDLRTPLASILGAATSLNTEADALDPAARGEMARTIQEEAERLNRFIANLLDMTRLESGAIVPRASLVDLSELVGSALERCSKILAGHRVELRLAADLPMLDLDAVLFEQVLFNLLDNAAKHSPAGSTIALEARRAGGLVELQLLDQGEGIPAQDLERIFDKFYRVQAADRQRAGTGLGLAICRGFVEASGGTIRAGNRGDGPGAAFTITLPAPRSPGRAMSDPG